MRAITAVLIVTLTGCSTVEVSEGSSLSEAVGASPSLHSEHTTPVGGTIYTQHKNLARRGYRLTMPVTVPVLLGKVVTQEGEFVARAKAGGEDAFCTEALTYIDPLTGPFRTSCFVDRDGDGTIDVVKASPGAIWIERTVPPGIRAIKGEMILPKSNSFKYELLYQGFAADTLRVSYREYADDFARPAFFQDVSYELPKLPAMISFKTVRLEILRADNSGLTYRVLSGF